MKKKNSFTDKELADLKMKWYEMGKRQAQKELRSELANVLGLYEIFETISE